MLLDDTPIGLKKAQTSSSKQWTGLTFFFLLLIRQVLVDSHNALRRATVSGHKLIQYVHRLLIDKRPCSIVQMLNRSVKTLNVLETIFKATPF